MLRSVIATAREESIYLPVMARLLKVEQMTEMEKLRFLNMMVVFVSSFNT